MTPIKPVSIEAQLASSVGRKDEAPNVALAHRIADTKNTEAASELIALLTHAKQPIRHDAIKVLYEIGALAPSLIAPYLSTFAEHMRDKSNRMVWGCLTAIHTISGENPSGVYRHLNDIIAVADKSSVIAKDQAINILCTLAAHPPSSVDVVSRLLERIKDCAVNQLPMYAEKAAGTPLSPVMKAALCDVLKARLNDNMPPSKTKRLQAVIKKLS